MTTDAFPAEAGPTRWAAVGQFNWATVSPSDGRDAVSGTGFSLEEVGVNTMNLAV